MNPTHLLLDFFSHEGIGWTIGLIFAGGMIVGTAMMYLSLTWKQVFMWMLAFALLVVSVETVRLEIFNAHGEVYTWLPILTGTVPFVFYSLGIGAGAWIAHHWCVDEKEVLKQMLEEYERKNGNGHAEHAN